MVGLKPDGKSNPVLLTRDSKAKNIFGKISFLSPLYPIHIGTKNIEFRVNP
jgi:hypothetical protein